MGGLVRVATAVVAGTLLLHAAEPAVADLLYSPEGNRLRRYDIDSIKQPPLREDVLVERASAGGRDINGMICLVPDGTGRFIGGEDTGQQSGIPPGWGIFAADGTQVGKLTATYFVSPGDPFGCAFDSHGRLFTTEIGSDVGTDRNGQLIMWFPPYDGFPGTPGTFPNGEHSTNFCKLASNIGTATSIAIDEQDRVYVVAARGTSLPSGAGVIRFSPPFPTGPDAAGGCGGVDALGSPVADTVHAEPFINDYINLSTPTGIARARNGDWYVASVLTGVIAEYTPEGSFIRRVLQAAAPGLPTISGNPQGLAVDRDGDLYFADLQLVVGADGIGPGPNGKVRWIHFDEAGTPQPPVTVHEHLAFPDAVSVLPGTISGCTDNCVAPCTGDCNADGFVTINELVLGVDIMLGTTPLTQCDAFDEDDSSDIMISELVAGVNAALGGCRR